MRGGGSTAMESMSHDLSTSLLAEGLEMAAVNITPFGRQSTVLPMALCLVQLLSTGDTSRASYTCLVAFF